MEYLIMAVIVVSGCTMVKTASLRNMIFFLVCLYMWILIGFNVSSPDYAAYEYMYTHLSYYGLHEPGFVLLMRACLMIGVSYQQFRLLFATIIVVMAVLTVRRLTGNKNIVMAMFLIIPLLGYATIMRQAIAASIICYTVTYLIESDNRKTNVKYIIGVLFATLFHYTSVFYIVLLFCKSCYFKKSVVFMGVFTEIAMFGIISSGLAYKLVSSIINNDKVTNWFNYSNLDHPKWSTVIVFILCQCLLLYFVKRSAKTIIDFQVHSETEDNKRTVILNRFKSLQYVIRINYLMFWLIPGYMINFNFTRMLFWLFLLDTAVIAQAISLLNRHGKRQYETPRSIELKGALIIINIAFFFLTEGSLTEIITDNLII